MNTLRWLSLVLLLCAGCGPKRVAEHAPQSFLQPVATLKVAVESGCTLREFRQYRTAVESSYVINEKNLSRVAGDIRELRERMRDCELMWSLEDMTVMPGSADTVQQRAIEIMLRIKPSIRSKFSEQLSVMLDDPDFTARTYLPALLAEIQTHCDQLLTQLR